MFRKFLLAELLWGAGIAVLIVPLTILSDPLDVAAYVVWLARAFVIAAFAAGITVANDIFTHERPWTALASGTAAVALVALLLLALVTLAPPLLDAQARTLSELIRDMTTASHSWQTRNDAAWRWLLTLFVPLRVFLLAGIGLQVGVWAQHAVPAPLRRLLYWVVALGLIVSDYAVSDTTYEGVLLHVDADVFFAAFYTLLLPLGICAGLALPTLALLGNATVSRRIA